MEERKVTETLIMRDVRLIFKNFAGEESKFNKKGDRNFGVLLSDSLAEKLAADGWRIRHLKPREDDPEQYMQPWLKVNIKYANSKIPPTANLVTSRGKKRLTEETIDQLDWTRMKKCDVKIRPYNYPAMPGRPAGVSAYLSNIYVTVLEDELDEDYADVPDLDEDYE